MQMVTAGNNGTSHMQRIRWICVAICVAGAYSICHAWRACRISPPLHVDHATSKLVWWIGHGTHEEHVDYYPGVRMQATWVSRPRRGHMQATWVSRPRSLYERRGAQTVATWNNTISRLGRDSTKEEKTKPPRRGTTWAGGATTKEEASKLQRVWYYLYRAWFKCQSTIQIREKLTILFIFIRVSVCQQMPRWISKQFSRVPPPSQQCPFPRIAETVRW
jgi:hypothetical protein